jgi:putative hydrolase of the HAD superfamily
LIRAVLWDVGGTLVDFALSREQWFEGPLRACGIDPESLGPEAIAHCPSELALEEDLCQTRDQELAWHTRRAEQILRGHRVERATIEDLGKGLAEYFSRYKLVDGIGELLVEISGRGIVQAVVSNWPASLRDFLGHHGVARFFKKVICSGDVGILKPDVRMFQRALEQLAVLANEAIFIGNDVSLDIAPARALGMHTILFDPRRQCERPEACTVGGLRLCLERVMR